MQHYLCNAYPNLFSNAQGKSDAWYHVAFTSRNERSSWSSNPM